MANVYRLAAIQSICALSDGLVMDLDVPLKPAQDLLHAAHSLRSRILKPAPFTPPPAPERPQVNEALGFENHYTPREAVKRLCQLCEELGRYQVPVEVIEELESLEQRFRGHLQTLPAFWDSYEEFVRRMCVVC